MPKLSFNPDNINDINKCKNCIHSHKINVGDKIYYECFPVKEYSTTKNAIDNCNKFYNSERFKRDIYVSIIIYVLYPEFDQKITPMGAIFRGFEGTDDDLWNQIKNSDLYEKVRTSFPNIGLCKDTLFEPIIFAERNVNFKEWYPISLLLKTEEKEEILNELNNKNYDND
jgi:hypothetical protein